MGAALAAQAAALAAAALTIAARLATASAWSYYGCIDEGTFKSGNSCPGSGVAQGYFDQTLSASPDALMTNRLCAALAVPQGFITWGTQDGFACFGGHRSATAPIYKRVSSYWHYDNGLCNVECTGNAEPAVYANLYASILDKAQCGGKCVTSLFTWNVNAVPKLPAVDSEFIGCYQDCSSTALPGGTFGLGSYHVLPVLLLSSYYASAAFDSVDLCLQLAGNLGYHLAGISNGHQCYAGNNLTLALSMGNGNCSTPCTQNATEMCGGNCSLSLFAVNRRTLSPTSRPTTPRPSLLPTLFPSPPTIVKPTRAISPSLSPTPLVVSKSPTVFEAPTSSSFSARYIPAILVPVVFALTLCWCYRNWHRYARRDADDTYGSRVRGSVPITQGWIVGEQPPVLDAIPLARVVKY